MYSLKNGALACRQVAKLDQAPRRKSLQRIRGLSGLPLPVMLRQCHSELCTLALIANAAKETVGNQRRLAIRAARSCGFRHHRDDSRVRRIHTGRRRGRTSHMSPVRYGSIHASRKWMMSLSQGEMAYQNSATTRSEDTEAFIEVKPRVPRNEVPSN